MKNMFLRLQLRKQGASKQNAHTLSDMAKHLSHSVPSLSNAAKTRIADEVGFKPVKISHPLRYSAAGASFAVMILVFIAQSAQPGSVLYALKRGSEEVRVLVQPGFDREDIQQRRDDENNEQHESQGQDDNTYVDDNDDSNESHQQDDDSRDESQDAQENENSENNTEDSPEDTHNEQDNVETPEIKPESETESHNELEEPKSEDFSNN